MGMRYACILLALALASSAQAQNAARERTSVKKVVLADTKTKVASLRFIDPDCSSMGKVTIRLTREPKNGKSEVAAGMEFPNYPADNVRSKCNTQKVEATEVWYTPGAGFKGKETFEFEMIGPTGQYRRTRVDIEVK